MGKMDEIILVTPRTTLFEDEALTFQGVLSDKGKVEEIMDNTNEFIDVMRRGDAEENEAYKQPIPYAVIRRGDDLFVYERLSGGGETRLHNKLSLGAGGHMNAVEGVDDFYQLMQINLERELEEELDITDKNFKIEIVGLINDDSEDVSRVHIGILAIIDVDADSDVYVREVDQLKGSWATLEQLKQDDVYERLEGWSKIVVDIL